MLNDGDIVRITDKQSIGTTELINVFYYAIEVLVAGITLLDVLEDFKDFVLTSVRLIQHTGVDHVELIADNLTNGVDTETIDPDIAGTDTSTGTNCPDYVAAGYRLNLANKTVRTGGKRFGGLDEGRVDGNTLELDGTDNTTLEGALAFVYPVTHTPAGSGDAVPIVVGRDVLGVLDLDRTAPIISATVITTVRSQVSRRASAL